MILRVGITGGIGAGKSTISKIFGNMGIPIFNSDQRAKDIMDRDDDIRKALIAILGPEIYSDTGTLNRVLMADKVFENDEILKAVQNIIKSRFDEEYNAWCQEAQKSGQHEDGFFPYLIVESAIFYETRTQKMVDLMIGVDAPKDIRIIRACERNPDVPNIFVDTVRREKKQNHEDNMHRCDFVIQNIIDNHPPIFEVERLHATLIKISKLIKGNK